LYVNIQSIVNRYIKPANILVVNGNLKLADFGLARTFNEAKDLMHTNVGTPYYQAPEIWSVGKYDEKADLWSLGILLF
jgi:serine/threonine protein kinase